MNRFRNLRARLNNMNGVFALMPNPLTRVELPGRASADPVTEARTAREPLAHRDDAPPGSQSAERPRT